MRAQSSRSRPAQVTVIGAPEGRVALMRMIWTLAWPVMLTFALESIVGLVDTLMVGRLGAAAVAGVGVGTQILNGVSVVMTAVITGTVALVARYIGAGDPAEAEEVLLQSLYAVGTMSCLIAAPVFWWAREIIRLFGVEPAVLEQATGFVRIIVFAVPGTSLFYVMASGLRGAGDMRTPLMIGAFVNVVNVLLNYILIFGHLGLPALGVRGSALASSIALASGALCGLVVLLRGRSVLSLRHLHYRVKYPIARRVLAIGMPTAVEQMLMQIGFMLYLAIAARYGTAAVAAYFIGVRILALSFLPGFGFSAAASTLVGQNLGARQLAAAERSGWEANRLAILFHSIGGAIIFIGAPAIARMFIDDPEVVRDAVAFIRTLAVAQPLMAADSALGGALRGAGDTRFPLITVIVGFYGARLGFAYAAASLLSLSINWVWIALIGDYLARAALKAWRFQSGHWKRALPSAVQPRETVGEQSVA